ncbi:serine/threonine-protein kinase [Streptomyces sp. CA-250714]|uniref:serine/threonine-protein kinase n=1 Tax=Streptomyces sp. CA-250714 TaxID=3240060 RepID=UPI003D8B80FD
MSEDAGRLVGGRYRLGGVLGRGGMGTVWRGEDEILGRRVAVKELRFPSSVDEEEKQRLITRTLREAKAIARIRSGSAVTVFDVVNEDSRPWIVMELVEGRSLADKIKTDGPLDPQRAAEVGLAILDVLRAAHREGILHRDVKPSNVLLEDGTGRVVLTDFGIAKVEGDPSVTSTGMLVGAPSYISPERARGKPPGPPADLWSLGGLLFAAVEGRPPYDKGSAISTLTAVMTEPVPYPEHAGELRDVISGLLVKDPEKRLDVDGARLLLEPVASGHKSPAPVDGPAERTSILPPVPDAPSSSAPPAAGKSGGSSPGGPAYSPGTTGGRRKRRSEGSSSGERLRGAFKSVRNAAGGAGSAGAGTAGSSGRTGTGSGSGSRSTGGAASGGTRSGPKHGGSSAGGAASSAARASSTPPPPTSPPPSAPASPPRPSTPPSSSPGRHSVKKGDDAARRGGQGARTTGAAAAGSGAGAAGAGGGRTEAGHRAEPSNGAGTTPGSGTGGSGGAPLPGTGSGGRALPPESGGSDAITSLRDLRELPELRKGIPRRTLAIAAAAVVVVILVIVLIVANLGGGGGDNASKGGSADTSEGNGQGGSREAEQVNAGTAGQSDEKPEGEQGGKADDGGKQDDAKGDEKDKPELPDGYAQVKDGRFHFSVALPDHWKPAGIAGKNSGRKYAPPGGGYPRIQIDHTSSPGGDAVGAWRSLEPAVKGSSPGYKSLGIKKVDWRGYPTVADWQFLRKENGKKVHALNRGFKVDGKNGYAILITCKADGWQDKPCVTLRKTAFASFKPHG